MASIQVKLAAAHFPTGKTARRLANVALGIIAFTQAKQLHHLAGVVLVGVRFAIRRRVEIDEHGGIARHAQHDGLKRTERLAAEELVLPVHEQRVLHLLGPGGEVAVPEQRQLFAQRVGRVHQAVQPPGRQFLAVAAGQNCFGQPRRVGSKVLVGRARQQHVDRLAGSAGDGVVERLRIRGEARPAVECAANARFQGRRGLGS